MHSTRGFLYLTNYNLSKINLGSKYVELACDIIFNDEIFDKDGNPSGGDGVVYKWKSISSAADISFDGRNKSIYGFYYNDITTNYGGLFGNYRIKTARNLTFESVYVASRMNFGVVGRYANIVENVDVLSGGILGGNTVGGIIAACKIIRNCSNYAFINFFEQETLSSGYIGGIVGRNIPDEDISIENCNNYGNMKVSTNSGGIVGICGSAANVKIYNCKNYGSIDGAKYGFAGIMGYSTAKGTAFIENCFNFGKISCSSEGGNSSSAAGIVGRITGGATTIKNCANMTTLFVSEGGDIVGQLSTEYTEINESILQIVDCNFEQKQNSLIAYLDSNANGDMTIKIKN